MPEAPIVPSRNDPEAEPLFVKASVADQAGSKPGYVRQWFSTDPLHRNYFGNYTKPHQIGNPEIGYCACDAWTTVHRDEAKPGGRKRDDDTAGIDTRLTHGDLVCLETTVANAARYAKEDELKDRAQARRLQGGDDETIRDETGKAVARYRARVGSAANFGTPQQLLREGA